MAAKDGRAMMMLTLAPGSNLEEAANAIMKNYQLTPVESRKENINGLSAIQVVAIRPRSSRASEHCRRSFSLAETFTS